MVYWLAGSTLLTMLFVGAVGYYLVLIAKFYRLKFARGPKPVWMQSGLFLLVLGVALRLPWFAEMAGAWWQGCITLGGLLFSGTTYLLYRNMMMPQ
jgi:hypothetical protein